MKSKGFKAIHSPVRALCGALAALPLLVAADLICVHLGHVIRIRNMLLLAVLVCALFAFCAVKLRKLSKLIGTALLAVYILCALFALCWYVFSASSAYHVSDSSDKSGVFADRSVMLIVPHQDDEFNVMGGLFEEFLSYGSEVRVVYLTNGDYHGQEQGTLRLSEVLDILGDIGIPEQNVIFLGYSDSMSSDNGYFYDLEDENEQVYSADRSVSATYGVSGHPAYNDGNSFSLAHAEADMKACILEYRPDTIICVDNDGHPDHQATSLIFESVMGEILSEEPDYTPLVLKGFAYSTGYYAAFDFYDSVNILSTVNPGDTEYMAANHSYLWQDRLRLPVSADGLARSQLECSQFKTAVKFKNQVPFLYTRGFLNGDKVFWYRSTDSLTYSADISASSGDAALLSDFMLGDNYDVANSTSLLDGVWTPSEDDAAPDISVTLASPSDISLIRLYDAPSLDDNILKVTVTFDSGSVYEAGPLTSNGSASDIAVSEADVSSFTVTVVESEGSAAGLTELEAFSAEPEHGLSFIKLMDEGGNFVYDYITGSSGEEVFSLYAVGAAAELNAENYSVSCENASCSAEIKDGMVYVSCPKGEATVLSIQSADGAVSDSVYIQNPRFSLTSFWMSIEESAFDYIAPAYRESATGKLLALIGL